jgi:putative endonuclease
MKYFSTLLIDYQDKKSLHFLTTTWQIWKMELVTERSHIYILSNNHRTVLYVGCTQALKNRIYFHKKRLIAGFTKKYNVSRLVYYEELACLDDALAREKQIKGYRREKKNRLIELVNPDWNDLYGSVLG